MKTLFLTFISINLSAANIKGKLTIVDKMGKSVSDTCSQNVVFIEKVEGHFTPGPDAKVVAKESEFNPSVLPILKGTKVSFPNEDLILHNVFSLSKTKKFDLGLYEQGPGKDVVFDKSGLVKVFCNIHPGMVSNVLILDNPYYAQVKNDCSYEIKNVPVGKYRLNAWYRFGKGGTRDVDVVNADLNDINFEIKETKKRKKKHKNKFGKTYKKSY